MFKTFGEVFHDIEQLYDQREYQKVVISCGKLTEKVLFRIFALFHSTLPEVEKKYAFLSFEEEQGDDYILFLKRPSIGVGIRYYLSLVKLFPQHKWSKPDLKIHLNCINRWRNIEAHAAKQSLSDEQNPPSPKDEDAAKVLQATEDVLHTLNMVNQVEAGEGISLTEYLRYAALKENFDSAIEAEHYKIIIEEGQKLAVELLNLLLDRLYYNLGVEEKRKLLDFQNQIAQLEKKSPDLGLYRSLFRNVPFYARFPKTKRLNDLIGRFSAGDNVSYTRRATSPYMQVLDIVYQLLVEPEQQTVFRICDRINQMIFENGTLSESDRQELQGIANYEGISETELNKTIELVTTSISSFLNCHPKLRTQKPSPSSIETPAAPNQPLDNDFFMEFEELLYGRLAPVLVEAIGCIWLNPNYEKSSQPFKDFLRKYGGAKAVSRGLAAFKSLEEALAGFFKPHFIAIKDDKVRSNLLKNILWVMENHPPHRRLVDDCIRHPRLLYQKLSNHTPKGIDQDIDKDLFNHFQRLLLLTCELIIDLFEGLPPWNSDNLMDILGNQEVLLGRCHQIIKKWGDSVQSFSEANRQQFDEDFRREVARRFDELNLFGIDISKEAKRYQLSVAYISLSMEIPESGDQTEGHDSYPVEEVLSQHPRVVILGDAGQGKTTLMQWLTVMCSRQTFPNTLKLWNSKIPFLIKLRTVLDRELPPVGEFTSLMANEILTDNDKHRHWEHQILTEGRAIVMVDGFDEVPEERRKSVTEWLSNLCAEYPKNRFILTSRPSSYKKEYSMVDHGFKLVKLQPMTPVAMREFVLHWHRAISLVINPVDPEYLNDEAEKLLDELKQKKSLRLLVTNPLLCGVICALHHDRHGYLPNNRTEIYEATCQMLLERRDLERKVTEQDVALKSLSYTDKRIFLNDVAQWMMLNSKTIIHKKQLLKLFKNKINYLPNLREKGLSEGPLLEYFLERSGLLQQIGTHEIHFAHRTFQEYMAAKDFVDKDSMGFLKSRAGDDYWTETILLALGLCSNNSSNQFIFDLLKIAQKQEEKGSPVKATRLYLLIMRGKDTMRQILPGLQKIIESKIQTIIPPDNRDKRMQLVASGELALPFLGKKPNRTIKDDLSCALTLLQMRVEEAYAILLDYFDDQRPNFIANLKKLLLRVDAQTLEQTGLVELMLRKGPHRFPIEIVEALVGVSRDFRLYKMFPQKHLKFTSNKIVIDLKTEFDWYVPTEKSVTFHFNVENGAYLSSIQHLPVESLSISKIDELAFTHIRQMTKLKKLEIRKTKEEDAIVQLIQLSQENRINISLEELVLSYQSLVSFILSSYKWKNVNPGGKLKPRSKGEKPHLKISKIIVKDYTESHTKETHLITTKWENIVRFTDIISKQAVIGLIHVGSLQMEKGSGRLAAEKLFNHLVELSRLAGSRSFKISMINLEIRNLLNPGLEVVLENLVNVQKLLIHGISAGASMLIKSFPPKAKLRHLQTLDLSKTTIKTLNRFSELTNLKELSLSYSNIKDLAALHLPTTIVKLNLDYTRITDIKPLSKLTELRELSLRSTDVKDLEPLNRLKKLQHIDIRQTDVKDASYLASIPSLKTLSVHSDVDISAIKEIFEIRKSSTKSKIMIRGKRPAC